MVCVAVEWFPVRPSALTHTTSSYNDTPNIANNATSSRLKEALVQSVVQNKILK